MKKLNLTIPKPCHENWDQMSQAEKGKFCGACQKTVIDFTNMSDRELAQFFKKPKTDVCGRFYNDQLHREITIPKKRIPWFKYFFQITWPAFVLVLKGCGDRTVGKLSINKTSIEHKAPETMHALLGFVMPGQEIDMNVDSSMKTIPDTSLEDVIERDVIVGEIEIQTPEAPPESVIKKLIDTPVISSVPLDTITVYSYPVMGKVACVAPEENITKGEVVEVQTIDLDPLPDKLKYKLDEFKLYPNPVRAGSMLTMSFSEENIPEQVEIISASGQLIARIKQDHSDYAEICNINIPANVSAGIYFVRTISQGKILKATKLVVVN